MDRFTFPSSEPTGLAKWFLIAFAIGLVVFEGVSAFRMWKLAGFDTLLSLAFVPWIVSPAAAAALLVGRARSRIEAWLFLGAEVAAGVSTACLWIWLIYIEPDAQNGVAMMLFPVLQFAALLVAALGVIATADIVLKNRQEKKPRVVLLTILAIMCAILLLVPAWAFGYIRA